MPVLAFQGFGFDVIRRVFTELNDKPYLSRDAEIGDTE
jgi:hypothetical protein